MSILQTVKSTSEWCSTVGTVRPSQCAQFLPAVMYVLMWETNIGACDGFTQRNNMVSVLSASKELLGLACFATWKENDLSVQTGAFKSDWAQSVLLLWRVWIYREPSICLHGRSDSHFRLTSCTLYIGVALEREREQERDTMNLQNLVRLETGS